PPRRGTAGEAARESPPRGVRVISTAYFVYTNHCVRTAATHVRTGVAQMATSTDPSPAGGRSDASAPHSRRPSPRRALGFRLAALLGPAFVAAVAYVDPGNVAANVTAGSRFGYLLLWVL